MCIMWGWFVGSDSLVNTYLQYWSWRCACNVMQGMGDFLNEMVDIMCQDECNVESLSFVLYLTLRFNSIQCNMARFDYRKMGRRALRSCKSCMRNCFRVISKHLVPPLRLWTILPVHHLHMPLVARALMLPTSVIPLKCTQEGPKMILDLMPTLRDFVLGLVLSPSLYYTPMFARALTLRMFCYHAGFQRCLLRFLTW